MRLATRINIVMTALIVFTAFGIGVFSIRSAEVQQRESLERSGYRVIAAGELWFRLHPYSLNLSQAVVQRYIHPGLWDPLIVSILQWPFWSIFGAPGAVLAVLFGPWLRKKG